MDTGTINSAESKQLSIREFLLHSLLLLILVAILFPATFLNGEHITPAALLYAQSPWDHHVPDGVDIPSNAIAFEPLTTFYYWYALTKEAIEGGEWPLWNPQQFCGLPLLANFQSAVFYPPRVLHAFLELNLASTLFIMLRVWLCGATAFVAARGMGLGRTASQFASFAWMLSMYNMVWVYWPVPDTSAWAPIVLLGVERALQGRYRQAFFAVATGGTLILLAGHPETAFTFGIGIGAYFLIRLALERRSGRRLLVPMLVVGGAWIPALLLCSVQLLPFVEYVLNSYTFATRSESTDVVQKLLNRAVVALWVPRFFGANVDGNLWGLYSDSAIQVRGESITNTNHISYLYVGIVAWVALLGACSRVRHDRLFRHRAIAVAIPGAIGLLLAIEHPVLGFVHGWPLFSSIVRTYYVNFLLLGLVFLSAMGVEALVQERFSRGNVRWMAAGLGILAVVIAIVFVAERPGMVSEGVTTYVAIQIAVAGLLCVLALAVFVIGSMRGYGKTAGAMIVLLLVFDLLFASRDLRPAARTEHILTRTDLFDALHSVEDGGRTVLLTAHIPAGVAQMYGVEVTGGYDAITPLRVQEFLHETQGYQGRVERILGATHYVFPGPPMDPLPARFELVAEADGYAVYRNRLALPRTFLIGEVEVVDGREGVFARMAEADFDAGRTVVTAADIAAIQPGEAGELGTAVIVERRLNSVRIEVNIARNCALVLSDAFYPGWNVYVDGARAELFPADYAFMGVILPEGAHEVSFRYEPVSFRVGLWISVVTGVLGVMVSLAWVVRLRRSVNEMGS